MSSRESFTVEDCEILVARELRRAGIDTAGMRRARNSFMQVPGGWRFDLIGRLAVYERQWSALIECRNATRNLRAVDVDDVSARARTAGTRSALLFATPPFDDDAVARADELRIALLHIIDAHPALLAAGIVQPGPLPAWVPELTVQLVTRTADGVRHRLLEPDEPELILTELRARPLPG